MKAWNGLGAIILIVGIAFFCYQWLDTSAKLQTWRRYGMQMSNEVAFAKEETEYWKRTLGRQQEELESKLELSKQDARKMHLKWIQSLQKSATTEVPATGAPNPYILSLGEMLQRSDRYYDRLDQESLDREFLREAQRANAIEEQRLRNEEVERSRRRLR